MRWFRRHPCEHPEPREITAQVSVTDADGNVRAVAVASAVVICEHWEQEGMADDGA